MIEDRCPCGLNGNDVEMCIDGDVYGYCESPDCGGYCEATHACQCTCHTEPR